MQLRGVAQLSYIDSYHMTHQGTHDLIISGMLSSEGLNSVPTGSSGNDCRLVFTPAKRLIKESQGMEALVGLEVTVGSSSLMPRELIKESQGMVALVGLSWRSLSLQHQGGANCSLFTSAVSGNGPK